MMQSLVVLSLFCVFLCSDVWAIYFKNFLPEKSLAKNNNYDSKEIQNDTLTVSSDDSYLNHNASEYLIEKDNFESSNAVTNETYLRIDEANSTFPLDSTEKEPNTSSSDTEITLTEIFKKDSNSTSSVSDSPSSSTKEQTKSRVKTTPQITPTNASSAEDDEEEGVVRDKPSSTESTGATLQPENIYQKALALINDTYTLSIIIPVAAGIMFASTTLITIATCRCLKKRCVRRRLRKKTLPDSVKNLRPSDRARLLAESSDEEF